MNRNKVLCIVGGIISIISVFLPVFTITFGGIEGAADRVFYFWLFGLVAYYRMGLGIAYIYWSFDPFFMITGLICMILIITGAIIVIVRASKESKNGKFGSILIMATIVSYFALLFFLMARNVLTPSYGFFVALIGGIISLIGSKQGD